MDHLLERVQRRRMFVRLVQVFVVFENGMGARRQLQCVAVGGVGQFHVTAAVALDVDKVCTCADRA